MYQTILREICQKYDVCRDVENIIYELISLPYIKQIQSYSKSNLRKVKQIEIKRRLKALENRVKIISNSTIINIYRTPISKGFF